MSLDIEKNINDKSDYSKCFFKCLGINFIYTLLCFISSLLPIYFTWNEDGTYRSSFFSKLVVLFALFSILTLPICFMLLYLPIKRLLTKNKELYFGYIFFSSELIILLLILFILTIIGDWEIAVFFILWFILPTYIVCLIEELISREAIVEKFTREQSVQTLDPHQTNSEINGNTVSNLYCARCGNEISSDTPFCKCCGKTTDNHLESPSPFPSEKRNVIITAIIILLIVIILLVILF